jgi:hypothetical protein
MDTDRDDMRPIFLAIAREDAEDAARRAPRIEARLAEEWRARARVDRKDRTSRAVGLAIAAMLVAGLAAQMWLVARRTYVGVDRGRTRPPAEIATEFMPLPYSAVPFTDARLVRLEVPRTALAEFGLTPVDAAAIDRVESTKKDTILADVLVGEDGLARAVRFVRAPRAPGVAP